MAAPTNEPIVDIGEEQEPLTYIPHRVDDSIFVIEKDVSPKDIFKLAKSILTVSCIIFALLAILRMLVPLWYSEYDEKHFEGVKEVWDFSKVALNSIVSLVLGLYFGSKAKTD